MSKFPEHIREMVEAIRGAPIAAPPFPWRGPFGAGIGGLTEVGFGPGSDLLLVASSQGRGVFDCLDGSRIARDRDELGDWIDEIELTAEGIGPLSGQTIRMSGLHGGGLPSSTRDGWRISEFTLDWPERSLVVTSDYRDMFEMTLGRKIPFVKVAVEYELRAYGFSPTGRSLVIATSSDLTIYSRDF